MIQNLQLYLCSPEVNLYIHQSYRDIHDKKVSPIQLLEKARAAAHVLVSQLPETGLLRSTQLLVVSGPFINLGT